MTNRASATPSLGLHDSYNLVSDLFSDLRRGSGSMVISSAGGAEYALESPAWSNGVFTYSVLAGLKEKSADANGDGTIRISEFREFVVEKVQKLTKGQQNPTSRRENLEQDFVLY